MNTNYLKKRIFELNKELKKSVSEKNIYETNVLILLMCYYIDKLRLSKN